MRTSEPNNCCPILRFIQPQLDRTFGQVPEQLLHPSIKQTEVWSLLNSKEAFCDSRFSYRSSFERSRTGYMGIIGLEWIELILVQKGH